MKVRIYCDLCECEYELPIGEEWVYLMSCPHDVEHHILKEVIEDDSDGGNRKLNTNGSQHD